jgi:hypothetical protein
MLYVPQPNETPDQINSCRALTLLAPSQHNMVKLVSVLALNGNVAEARQWMRLAGRLINEPDRAKHEPYWENQQRLFPQLKSQPWVQD